MKSAGIIAFVVVFLAASGGVFAQTLTGSWTTTATIVASPVTLGVETELVAQYSVSTWSFGLNTVLDETGWTRQSFSAAGTLDKVTLASRLTFSPASSSGLFSDWSTTATVALDGITGIGALSLTPGNVQLVLAASGSLGDVGLRGVATLGDVTPAGECDFGWRGVNLTVSLPFCCARVEASLDVGCDGFGSFTFRASRIAVPALPWATLSALLTFEAEEKSIVVSPSFSFGVDVCLNVYMGVARSGNLILGDFTVDGLGLTCLVGGVQFVGQSYWGTGSKPQLLSGTPYWEAYQLSTVGDECCGPVRFDATFFFLQGGVALFDLAEIVVNVSLELGTSFGISMGLSLPTTASGSVEWTIELLVDW